MTVMKMLKIIFGELWKYYFLKIISDAIANLQGAEIDFETYSNLMSFSRP